MNASWNGVTMGELAGAGTILSILGAASSTKSSVDALDEQAYLSEWESRAKRAQAASIRESAALEERQYGRRARLLQGKGIAMAAASGVSIKSGTPLFLELDNIKQATIGRLDILRRGELAAQGIELESAFKLREAQYASRAKSGAIIGGVLRGGSVLADFMGRSAGPGPSSVPTTTGGYPTDTFDG
jgi:hypothetical protein